MSDSIIDTYANQEFGWRSRTGTKDNGTAIFTPERPASPLTVMGLIDCKRRLIRNAQGEQIVSEAKIQTSAAVKEGDVVVLDGREWTVLQVKPVPGLLGAELHREVYL